MKKHLSIWLLITTIIFANPTSSDLFKEASLVLDQYNGEANKLAEAREILKKLFQQDPNSAEALILMGRLMTQDGYISHDNYRKEYLDEVKKISQEVIKKYPQRIEAYILYASSFMNDNTKEGLQEARKQLDIASKIDKNNIKLKLSYARLANKHKDNAEVIRLSNEIIAQSTQNWQKALAYSDLGTAYWRLKYFKRSGETYLKIIELEPTSPWALINYSSFLRKRKDFDGAIAYAKKSLALADIGMGWIVLSKAYYGKGHQMHWKNKDKINSKKWFQLGVDANPNSLDCHYGLGASYFHTGWVKHNKADILRAQKEYKECQRLEPGHKASLKELEKIKALLRRLG